MTGPAVIAACLKLVDRRPEVDPLTGAVRSDARSSGPSDADRAALEWALRLGEAWGREVVAVTAGPAAAEGVLRDALAAGARRAVRADLPAGAPSEAVAAALGAALGAPPPAVVLCGDWSLDRGSGSVPAFLAARLGAAQALGLVGLAVDPEQPGAVRAERRLDGGRRERLRVAPPAVLSVEGATARLRRASLPGLLGAARAAVEVIVPPDRGTLVAPAPPARVGPFRPRARVLPPPPAGLSARQRVLALTGALDERTPPQTLTLPPAVAAERLLEQLRAWGELG